MMLLVFGIVVLAFIAWVLDVPVPEGFSSPYRFRIYLATEKIKQAFGRCQELLGVRSRLENSRREIAACESGLPRPKTDGLDIKDVTFDDVRVRVYAPSIPCSKTNGYPAMIFLHGGGWVRGTIELFHFATVRLVRELNMVVVTVTYRLAPEHPFPAPFDDCFKASKYFLKNAASFGVNPERVVITGTSAGGNLTAAILLKLRDERFQPMPKRQQLIYPCLQAVDTNTPSMMQNKDGPLLTRKIMAWYWSMYVSGSDKYKNALLRSSHTTKEIKRSMSQGKINHQLIDEKLRYEPYKLLDCGSLPSDDAIWNELKETLMNPYCCPLMSDNLAGLPGTLIFNCKYDVLRDDGILYGKRLDQDGVNVEQYLAQCGFHGLEDFHGYPEGEEFFNVIAHDIKANL